MTSIMSRRTIDWSDGAPWGNHVTIAANGSWVLDPHDVSEASQS